MAASVVAAATEELASCVAAGTFDEGVCQDVVTRLEAAGLVHVCTVLSRLAQRFFLTSRRQSRLSKITKRSGGRDREKEAEGGVAGAAAAGAAARLSPKQGAALFSFALRLAHCVGAGRRKNSEVSDALLLKRQKALEEWQAFTWSTLKRTTKTRLLEVAVAFAPLLLREDERFAETLLIERFHSVGREALSVEESHGNAAMTRVFTKYAEMEPTGFFHMLHKYLVRKETQVRSLVLLQRIFGASELLVSRLPSMEVHTALVAVGRGTTSDDALALALCLWVLMLILPHSIADDKCDVLAPLLDLLGHAMKLMTEASAVLDEPSEATTAKQQHEASHVIAVLNNAVAAQFRCLYALFPVMVTEWVRVQIATKPAMFPLVSSIMSNLRLLPRLVLSTSHELHSERWRGQGVSKVVAAMQAAHIYERPAVPEPHQHKEASPLQAAAEDSDSSAASIPSPPALTVCTSSDAGPTDSPAEDALEAGAGAGSGSTEGKNVEDEGEAEADGDASEVAREQAALAELAKAGGCPFHAKLAVESPSATDTPPSTTEDSSSPSSPQPVSSPEEGKEVSNVQVTAPWKGVVQAIATPDSGSTTSGPTPPSHTSAGSGSSKSGLPDRSYKQEMRQQRLWLTFIAGQHQRARQQAVLSHASSPTKSLERTKGAGGRRSMLVMRSLNMPTSVAQMEQHRMVEEAAQTLGRLLVTQQELTFEKHISQQLARRCRHLQREVVITRRRSMHVEAMQSTLRTLHSECKRATAEATRARQRLQKLQRELKNQGRQHMAIQTGSARSADEATATNKSLKTELAVWKARAADANAAAAELEMKRRKLETDCDINTEWKEKCRTLEVKVAAMSKELQQWRWSYKQTIKPALSTTEHSDIMKQLEAAAMADGLPALDEDSHHAMAASSGPVLARGSSREAAAMERKLRQQRKALQAHEVGKAQLDTQLREARQQIADQKAVLAELREAKAVQGRAWAKRMELVNHKYSSLRALHRALLAECAELKVAAETAKCSQRNVEGMDPFTLTHGPYWALYGSPRLGIDATVGAGHGSEVGAAGRSPRRGSGTPHKEATAPPRRSPTGHRGSPTATQSAAPRRSPLSYQHRRESRDGSFSSTGSGEPAPRAARGWSVASGTARNRRGFEKSQPPPLVTTTPPPATRQKRAVYRKSLSADAYSDNEMNMPRSPPRDHYKSAGATQGSGVMSRLFGKLGWGSGKQRRGR